MLGAAMRPTWPTDRPRGAVPCGLRRARTLRLEAAMPLYGHELTEEIGPELGRAGGASKVPKGEIRRQAAAY